MKIIWKPLYSEIARTIFTVLAIIGVLILIINQQYAANQQAKNNHQLLINQQKIVAQLQGAVKGLEANNGMKLTDLQAHIDCIVNYFTTAGRTGNTTIDPNTCSVNNPIPVPASAPPKVVGVAPQPVLSVTPTATLVTQPSLSSPQPSSVSPASSPSPPTISRPGLIRQILNFLGL